MRRLIVPHCGEKSVAIVHRGGHGLLEKHVLARLQGGAADLGMQMVGHCDVDGIDVGILQEGVVVEVDRQAWVIGAGRGGGGLARARDGGEGHAGRLGDGRGVMPSPSAVPDEPEAHASPPR